MELISGDFDFNFMGSLQGYDRFGSREWVMAVCSFGFPFQVRWV